MAKHKRDMDGLRLRVKDARLSAALSSTQALLGALGSQGVGVRGDEETLASTAPVVVDIFFVGDFVGEIDDNVGDNLASAADVARRFEHLHSRYGRHLRLRLRRVAGEVREVLEQWIGLHLQKIPQINGERALVVPGIVVELLLADLLRHIGSDAAYSLFVLEPRRVFVHEWHHYSYVSVGELIGEAVRLRKARLVDSAEALLTEAPPEVATDVTATEEELLARLAEAETRLGGENVAQGDVDAGEIEFVQSVKESAEWARGMLEQLVGQHPTGLFDLFAFFLKQNKVESHSVAQWRALSPIANIPLPVKDALARKTAHELLSVYSAEDSATLPPPKLCGSFSFVGYSSIGFIDLSASDCIPNSFTYARTVKSAPLFVADEQLFGHGGETLVTSSDFDLSTAIEVASLEALYRAVTLQLDTLMKIVKLGHCKSTSKKFEGQKKKNASCGQVYRGRELLEKLKQASKHLLGAWETFQNRAREERESRGDVSSPHDKEALAAARKIGIVLEDVLHLLHSQNVLRPTARWTTLENPEFAARQDFADALMDYVQGHLSRVLLPDVEGSKKRCNVTASEIDMELIVLKTHESYDPFIHLDINAAEAVLLELLPFGRSGKFVKELIQTGDDVNLDVVFALSASHIHEVDVLDPVRIRSMLDPLLQQQATYVFQQARKPSMYATLKEERSSSRDHVSVLLVSTGGSPSYLYDESRKQSGYISFAAESEGLVIAVQSNQPLERDGHRIEPLFPMVTALIELLSGHDSSNLQFPVLDKLPDIISQQLRRSEVLRLSKDLSDVIVDTRKYLDEVQSVSLRMNGTGNHWNDAEILHEEVDQFSVWLQQYREWAIAGDVYHLRPATQLLSKKSKDLWDRARSFLEHVAGRVPCASRHLVVLEEAKASNGTEKEDPRKDSTERIRFPSITTVLGFFLAPLLFSVGWSVLDIGIGWVTGSLQLGHLDRKPKLN